MDPRFVDHFKNPRNVGELDDPHGRAALENPVCGDQIEVWVRIEDGAVSALSYRVLGCSGAIAAASVMSELVLGKPLEDALALTPEAVDEALGGLPTLKQHGADLAVDGLRTALRDTVKETP